MSDGPIGGMKACGTAGGGGFEVSLNESGLSVFAADEEFFGETDVHAHSGAEKSSEGAMASNRKRVLWTPTPP